MPVHKSAIKRVRQNTKKRIHNRQRKSTMRTLTKKTLMSTTREEGEKALTEVYAILDKLAKTGIIHKNKAANQKSRLAKHVQSLA